jgi:hypothetical protein
MVDERPAVLLLAPLEEREVHDPEECFALLLDQAELAA